MSGSMQQHKTVIAFDPGLTDTGVAVVRGDALLFSGTLRPKGEGLAERLGDLMEKTETLFQTYGPEKCDIEVASHFSYSRSRDFWTGKELNIKDLMKNGYATAVIMAVAGRRNVPTEERKAHTWKLSHYFLAKAWILPIPSFLPAEKCQTHSFGFVGRKPLFVLQGGAEGAGKPLHIVFVHVPASDQFLKLTENGIPVIVEPGNHGISKNPKDSSALAFLQGRPDVFVVERPAVLYLEGNTLSATPSESWPQPDCAKIFVLPFPSRAILNGRAEGLSIEEQNKAASAALRTIVSAFRGEIDGRIPNILMAHLTVIGATGAENPEMTKYDPHLTGTPPRVSAFESACRSSASDRILPIRKFVSATWKFF